ncbi:MAG: permease-like cell division protein FtsX [Clostridia bacterium]|nr:permease-like cell division protein FtsX [Loktanella sp.]MBQ1950217.1 permease-like cell division protein FtsX [Clostridia bacterium]
MKSHVVRYLIREGCRNTWQNRLMALASVGVLICCLLLTGFSYLVFVNIDHMFQNAYEQNVMAVYLHTDQTDEQVTAIGESLQAMDNVASVTFLSKEDFLAQYGEALADNTMESFQGEENPLPDTYIVALKDLALFQNTLNAIENMSGVEEVSYDANTAQTLTRVRRMVLGVGGAIIVVLLAVSLFIIVNTIKLTVYSRRLEIYIMKSVGATDGFVRFPFVVEGVLLGFTAGGLGYGLIFALYYSLQQNFVFENPLLSLVPFSAEWLPLLVGFLLGGVLVGVCGSVISMSKYLKQEGGIRP